MSWVVVDLLSGHRIDYRDVVCDRTNIGKGGGHQSSAFPVGFKFMLRAEALELVTTSLKLGELLPLGEGLRHWLSIEASQFWFMIQSFKMGGSTCHTEVNDSLGFWCEMQFFIEDTLPLGGAL